MEWVDELQRAASSPEQAARIRQARDALDVTEFAPRVRAPTLIVHARDDALVPFAEGRLIATLIPGARFLPLESANHVLLADEPAWPVFLAEVRTFLGAGGAPREAEDGWGLSAREEEILALVAEGLGNDEIAADSI
jgi:pimeloyl-ACP methyl ester carboxylesterase